MVQIPTLGKEIPEGRDSPHEADLSGSATAELKPGHANSQSCQSDAEVGKPYKVPIRVSSRAPQEELAKRRLKESQHEGYAGQDDERQAHGPIESAHPPSFMTARLFPDLLPGKENDEKQPKGVVRRDRKGGGE